MIWYFPAERAFTLCPLNHAINMFQSSFCILSSAGYRWVPADGTLILPPAYPTTTDTKRSALLYRQKSMGELILWYLGFFSSPSWKNNLTLFGIHVFKTENVSAWRCSVILISMRNRMFLMYKCPKETSVLVMFNCYTCFSLSETTHKILLHTYGQ